MIDKDFIEELKKEEVNLLQFVCPECESTRLYSIERATLKYELESIHSNGDIHFGKEEIGESNNDCIDHYECVDCGFEVGEGYINDAGALIEWIEEHCTQE